MQHAPLALWLAAAILAPRTAAPRTADVANPSVSVSNQVVSSNAVYTISLSVNAAVNNNDNFVVTFPTGTNIASLVKNDVTVYNVTTGNSAAAKSLTISGQQLTIQKGNAPAVGSGNLIRLIVGATSVSIFPNPPTQSDAYTVTV